MTLDEFAALLVTVDPKAKHYESAKQGNYTVWAEHGTNDLHGDDTVAECAFKVQVDRFTKIENDPVAAAIRNMLIENCIAHTVVGPDYEVEKGYIHHIWDCEVE